MSPGQSAGSGSGERVALASFLASALLAGGNAVAIRFSNRELAPLWGAGLRFALAAALLLGVMAVMKLPLPRGRALTGAVLFGLLGFGASYALGYYGLLYVHAGLAGTLLALTPLVTLLLAVLQRQERLRGAAILGSLLALVGVGVLLNASLRSSLPLLPLLAFLAGVFCFAQATVLVCFFPRVHPVTMNAVAMAVGAAVLVAGSLLTGEAIALPQRAVTWAALGYLVPVGSVLVFVLYLVVLRHWTASRAAFMDVIIPFVTVALSVWLLDEPITPGLAAGGLLIVAGVYFGALRPVRALPAPVEPASVP